jgi:hypothetical protein
VSDGRSLEQVSRDAFLAEAESLAQLMAHPSWPRFDALLTEMRLDAMEHMAQAGLSEIPYWQGVVATLREIKERPGQITATARSVMDEEAQQREASRGALDFVAGVHVGEDDL